MSWDLEGIDPNNIDDRLKEGRYQFMVQAVAEDDKGVNIVTAEVVAAFDPQMLGKTQDFRFWPPKPANGDPEQLKKSQNTARVQAKFLMAVGAVTKDDLVAAKARGEKTFVPDWSRAVGGFFFSDLSKNGKGYLEAKYGSYYTEKDAEVANNPKAWPVGRTAAEREALAQQALAANTSVAF